MVRRNQWTSRAEERKRHAFGEESADDVDMPIFNSSDECSAPSLVYLRSGQREMATSIASASTPDDEPLVSMSTSWSISLSA